MAYSAQSMYNPGVQPDDGRGLASGILAAGQGIAGGITQGYATRRADQQRAEDRKWRVEDRTANFQHDESMFDKRMALEDRRDQREENQKERERQQKEEAEAQKAKGTLAAFLQIPGFLQDTEKEAIGKMDAKTLSGYLAAKAHTYGDFVDAQKAEKDRTGKLSATYTDVAPEGSPNPIYRNSYTGQDQMGSRFPQQKDIPSDEELMAMGFMPDSAKYKMPAPAAERIPTYTNDGAFKNFVALPEGWILETDEKGRTFPKQLPPGMDEVAYRELKARKAAGLAPGKTKPKPGATESRINDLSGRLDAVK